MYYMAYPLCLVSCMTVEGVTSVGRLMEGMSLQGGGRGRGRGFVYREPRSVGQQN